MGSQGVKGGIQGIPWGHRVAFMSPLMIHEAYVPVYKCSKFFLHTGGRTDGSTRGSTRGPRGRKTDNNKNIQK